MLIIAIMTVDIAKTMAIIMVTTKTKTVGITGKINFIAKLISNYLNQALSGA